MCAVEVHGGQKPIGVEEQRATLGRIRGRGQIGASIAAYIAVNRQM